jgi:predicted transcriptional regulator
MWRSIHASAVYGVDDVMHDVCVGMSAISSRLPDDLDRKLPEEATRTGRPRSQLIREALEAELRDAALVLAADPEASQEAVELSEDFLAAENEALEGHWWR